MKRLAGREMRLGLVLFLLLTPTAGPALAQPADQGTSVACEVMGHDVILYNRGSAPLEAGTVVHWSAWMGRREGEHTLEAALQPFVGLQLSQALGASYLWDRPCEANIVTNP